MDKVSELTQATIAALLRDYVLWIGILSVVLAFALYVYFRPNALEFFTGSKAPEKKEGAEKAAQGTSAAAAPPDGPVA